MKAVVTVVGKDRVGIIFDVTKVLAENNVNVLNISQTILDGYFTMIMITDISKSNKSIAELRKTFSSLESELGVDIRIQHEDIFNSMHSI
ncbi:ACT domain-containing protein [uncultured Clostridium sp.]|uniref:ACT domain-containing protein n=1 Tax=uncultured Clostridium sp. TaxID=59620 RepID=UPI0025F8D453|nr:ACT domain-containing protein [uncultured Clostridium sp.]